MIVVFQVQLLLHFEMQKYSMKIFAEIHACGHRLITLSVDVFSIIHLLFNHFFILTEKKSKILITISFLFCRGSLDSLENEHNNVTRN